ncbi:hypothetical protein ACLRDC_12760 [Gluconacetobacter sacchari]|uniref:hypothetical protein n=1 Tax=Gluconacetobacter sacchari TaxID=92759 RepID=UPI0039B6827D
MANSRRSSLLPATAGLSVLIAGPAMAASQAVSPYDLSPLPVVTGTVAHYLPTPGGDIDGVILTDGTQVLCSHELGLAVAGLVKPGERISARGLRGRSLPIVRAYEIEDQRGRALEDAETISARLPVATSGPDIVVDGTVRAPLYSLHGRLVGAVMQDYTTVHLTPSEATRLTAWLQPGHALHAVGNGSTSALGTAIDAREIGPSLGQTIRVAPAAAPQAGPFPGSAAYDDIPGGSAHP